MKDTIYKQDAIDAFKKELTVGESKGNYVTICSAVSYEGAKQILESLPSAQPTYTDEEIQKMQDLEQAQIEKAYQLGYEEGKKDAQPEIIRCKDCIHKDSYDTDCPIGWSGKEYCNFAERREEGEVNG